LFESRYKLVAEIIKHVTNSLHHAANFPKRRLNTRLCNKTKIEQSQVVKLAAINPVVLPLSDGSTIEQRTGYSKS
jgi:hypothetical protein